LVVAKNVVFRLVLWNVGDAGVSDGKIGGDFFGEKVRENVL
jgi:hypothetical protein